jgi:hypothetical protein
MRYVQLLITATYGLIAYWYVAPAVRRLGRADALIAIMWIHVFRYVVLYLFQAQRDGYGISDEAALQLVVGDVAGALIALAAITLLRSRVRWGIGVAWLLVLATLADLIAGIRERVVEPPHNAPFGAWWLVFTFFAPLVPVSVPLLVWQLYSRRREPLVEADSIDEAAARAAWRAE